MSLEPTLKSHRAVSIVYAMLVAAVLLWASSAPVTKLILPHFAPGEVALGRFLVASLLLAITRPGWPNTRDLIPLSLIAFLSVAAYNTLMTIGLTTESSATAGVVTGLIPVFTALGAHMLTRTRPNGLTLVGLMLSLSGVWLSASLTLFFAPLTAGMALMVIGAFAAGWSLNLQQPMLERYTPSQVTTWVIWLGTVMLLVFAPGLTDSLQSAPLEGIAALIYLGVLPSGVAYALWAYGLKSLNATQGSSLLYVLPLLTLVIAWVLGEPPTGYGILGATLSLLGMLLVFKASRL